MVAEDLGALHGVEPIVRVEAFRLVLDEVLRPLELADVMVVDADPSQYRVGADRLARGLGEIRQVDGMRVRAGRLTRQAS